MVKKPKCLTKPAKSRWSRFMDFITGPDHIDPMHGLMRPPAEHSHDEQDETDFQHAAGNLEYGMPKDIIGKISADKIRVDAPITESISSTKLDTDQEYIDEMTTLLRRLNEMLANCPTGVTIRIETRDHQVFMNGRQSYKIVGTVGKTL